MSITTQQLSAIMPYAGGTKVSLFIGPLNATMVEYGINTPARQAAFLAQIGHESGQLRYVKELATGEAYEGRKDLGNTSPGDGVKYKGRGLIQITGRANYQKLALALGVDCVNNPAVLEEPMNSCRSAGWFWSLKGLNALADAGDFLTITKRINGGTNGLADRQALYARAKQVLGA